MALFKRKKKTAEEEPDDGGGVAVNGDAQEEEDESPQGDAEAEASESNSEADDGDAKSPDDSGGFEGGGDDVDETAEEDDGEDDGKKKKSRFKKPKKEKVDKYAYTSNPAKARRFFEHAETVAEARNYDYAIECYINGLHHDPDNMIRHEALREIALRRKVSGGKPAKFFETMKMKSKTKIDKVLRTEAIWSKDPLNLQRSIDMMKAAVEADYVYDTLNFGELAYWVGQLIMEKNETQKPPNKADILKIRDLFAEVGAWQESVNCTRQAMMLDPNDTELADQLKDLEAELAMDKGGYDEDARDAVRDMDEQEALMEEDQLTKSDDVADRIIQRRRAELAEDPTDIDKRVKLVRALAEKDSDDSENEAITILTEMLRETSNQRHKLAIGDIKIKQMARHIRDLRKESKEDPEMLEPYQRAQRERREFELIEFTERVKNYPTDKKWRFELGRRLFQAKRFDDAITAFQAAKEDPKYRAQSLHYLGRCYLTQKWFEESIETLKAGVEAITDDTSDLALNTKWYLMSALMQSAAENKSVDTAKEAQKIASQILQTDINYRNIKEVMEQIRSAVKKLQARDEK